MRIGLVAGEASGDLLGAGLIHELRRRVPGLCCEGVAGPLMQEAGCEAWEEADALAVMGLIEPLKEIPRLLRLRSMLKRRWLTRPPDAFVGIDAPDFNLGLEKALRRSGIPTIHYVSPTVWAWRPGRVHKIARAADTVLCLLPFEKRFYDARDIDAVFVGHPLADAMPVEPDPLEARRRLGIRAGTVLAVLPGSRRNELARLAGPFAGACRLLKLRFPELAFVMPVARPGLRALLAQRLTEAGVADCTTLVDGNAVDAIAAADLVLLASGTASLQAALLGRPMVVAYRVAPLTHALVRSFRLLKTPWIALPNLLTPEPLVPELLQGRVTAQSLAEASGALLADPERRARISRA
ncbi:MAG: lipid-A-disaccharide synthase, partial [Woeseiaceae bacterium]